MFKNIVKRIVSLSLVVCLVGAMTCQTAWAKDVDTTTPGMVRAADLPSSGQLSEKDSILKFLKENPQHKQEVMKILEEKGALNPDKSIKDDLGRSERAFTADTSAASATFIGTGYEYTFAGTWDWDQTDYQTTVWVATNQSYTTPLEATINESYTKSVEIQAGVTVGYKEGLEKVFEVSAGVNLSYKQTTAASTQYGMKATLQPRTEAKIKANAIVRCYSFREQYYVLGVPVGNSQLIGVFKPIAPHWYFNTYAI